MGFPGGERFQGSEHQLKALEKQFLRKSEFMRQHGVPIWNGEFGPVYANSLEDFDADVINRERIELLEAQLHIYDRHRIHWSIWLYKDIGFQGMVHTSPDSSWNRRLQPFLAKKKATQADAWGKHPSQEIDALMDTLVQWLERNAPAASQLYPPVWDTKRHMGRLINECFLSKALGDEFAAIFKGMSKKELLDMAQSFSFHQCVRREALSRTVKASIGA